MNRPNHNLLLFAAALAVGLAYLPWLGLHGIVGSSEAREAHVVALLCSGSDWILPLRNGLVPSKPILFHWLGAGVCTLGVSPLISARIISLLSAVAILIITAHLAASFGAKESRIARGTLAVWILSTTYIFINGSLDARVDMFFSLWVTLALALVLSGLAERTPTTPSGELISKKRWMLFWLVAGLAVLSKGPLGLALPFCVAALSLCLVFGIRRTILFLIRPTWGWGIFVVIAMPWYVLAAQRGGEAFVGRQLIFENIQRLLGGEFVNSQPWHFYLPQFLFGALPWSFFFIAAICVAIRRISRLARLYSADSQHRHRSAISLLIWFVTGLVLFSFATGKRPSYLLPLMPAYAAWTAIYIVEWWEGLAGSKRQRLSLSLLEANKFCCFLLFGGVILLVELLHPRLWSALGYADFYSVLLPNLRYAVAAAGVTGLLIVGYIFIGRDNSVRSIGTIQWAIVPLLFSFIVWIGFASKGQLKAFASIASEINNTIGSTDTLSVIRTRNDEYLDPVLFLLGREVRLQDPLTPPHECRGWFLHRTHFALWDICHCHEVKRMNEWYDWYKERHDRDLTLSKCE